jgi:hypothetical protein
MKNRSSERGSVVILSAVTMTGMIALIAFIFSVGLAYDTRSQLSTAADSAARAGAFEILKNGDAVTSAILTAVGTNAVAYHGDTSTTWITGYTLAIHRCSDTGATCASDYATKNYVEAFVSKTSPGFLSALLPGSFNPLARAVAGLGNSELCLITLGGPSTADDIDVGTSSRIDLPNCGIGDAGSIQGENAINSRISAGTGISVSGSCLQDCANMGSPIQYGQAPPTDPLAATIAAVPTLSGCIAGPSSGTLVAGQCYTGLTFANNSIVTLPAGTTYFTGPIVFGQNDTLTGTGATLVLTGTATLDGTSANSATVAITAPTSGSYPYISIYQPASNTTPMVFKNGVNWNVNGATYMPSAAFQSKNNFTTTTDCDVFIAASFLIQNGTGTFSDACTTFGGRNPIQTITVAE